jgi:ribonuclease HI
MLGTMDADTSGTTVAMATPDPSAPPRQAITVVYTDGACSPNPGPGGWAWAVPGGRFASGAAERSTNQRMEITAVLEAVRTLEGPLEVVSDSTYVINCFRDRWWEGWLRTGWITGKKQPVVNRDLWEPLIEIVQLRKISFRWVKGHSGDPMNDLVDQLALEAARTQRRRQGIAGTVRSPA